MRGKVKREAQEKLPTRELPAHVDEFINSSCYSSPGECYARWFFMLARLPAVQQIQWNDLIRQYKLFCKHKGKWYRCTGASRFGDVYLTSDFSRETGYYQRVELNTCSDWQREAPKR
jgi:hypothetical protein